MIFKQLFRITVGLILLVAFFIWLFGDRQITPANQVEKAMEDSIRMDSIKTEHTI